jgi:hypothetical protein
MYVVVIEYGYEYETNLPAYVIGIYNSRELAIAAGTEEVRRCEEIDKTKYWYGFQVLEAEVKD